MRINKSAAVMLSACALSLGTTLTASGAGNTFSSTLTPSSIHVGQTFKITSTHAKPSTSYYCTEIVIKGTAYGYNAKALIPVKSSAKGQLTCTSSYKAFKATVGGVVRHCPQTKADLKAKVLCGIGMSTADRKSTTSGIFAKVSS